MKNDILIIGGGAGGCAAALAALAVGRTVTITEEAGWPGGQLTSQFVPPDENLAIETHGGTRRYRQFRERVRQYYRDYYPLNAAARHDPLLNPGRGWVSGFAFEPRVGVAVLDAMFAWARSTGRVRWLFYRRPVRAETDGDRIVSVTVRDTRSGTEETLTGDFVIDATELGDLLPLAGIEHVVGAESQAEYGEPHAPEEALPDDVQAMTWCFPIGRDPRGGDHTIARPEQYARWKAYEPKTDPPWERPMLSWQHFNPKHQRIVDRRLEPNTEDGFRGLWTYRRIVCADLYDEAHRPNEVTLVNWPQNDYFCRNPLKSEEDRQAAFEEARQLSLSWLYWMQAEAPRLDGGTGYPELYLCPEMTGTDDGLAMYPYIREARRIKAEFTVTETHFVKACRPDGLAERYADSVGIGQYGLDLHPSIVGRHIETLGTCPFQIPMGALIPQRVENCLAGGKNLGVTHLANASYRLHPIEWNIGESAGLLAAFCLERRTIPRAVRADATLLAEFQQWLGRAGIPLAWPPS